MKNKDRDGFRFDPETGEIDRDFIPAPPRPPLGPLSLAALPGGPSSPARQGQPSLPSTVRGRGTDWRGAAGPHPFRPKR